MRNLRKLDFYRDCSPQCIAHFGSVGDHQSGRFFVGSPIDGAPMCVVASVSDGWDHVSVSRRDRVPVWTELEHVKRMFFEDHETAMQLHVPPADHRNYCETCLHLWRPLATAIPRPPAWMVA